MIGHVSNVMLVVLLFVCVVGFIVHKSDEYAGPSWTTLHYPLMTAHTLWQGFATQDLPHKAPPMPKESPSQEQSDAAFLQDVATLSYVAGPKTSARLSRIARDMTNREKILAAIGEGAGARGDVIARFIGELATNVNELQGRGLTTRILPDDALELHAALITEGAETAERLTLAGVAAMRAENRADLAELERERAVDIIDAQKNYIAEMHRRARALEVQLRALAYALAQREARGVRFVFIRDGNPQDMGIEEASDLMLALDLAGAVKLG